MWIFFRVYGKSMLNHCTGWYKYSSIFRNICPTSFAGFYRRNPGLHFKSQRPGPSATNSILYPAGN